MYSTSFTYERRYTRVPDRVSNLFRQTTKVHLADKLQVGSRISRVFRFLKRLIPTRSKEQLINKTEEIANSITMQAFYTHTPLRLT